MEGDGGPAEDSQPIEAMAPGRRKAPFILAGLVAFGVTAGIIVGHASGGQKTAGSAPSPTATASPTPKTPESFENCYEGMQALRSILPKIANSTATDQEVVDAAGTADDKFGGAADQANRDDHDHRQEAWLRAAAVAAGHLKVAYSHNDPAAEDSAIAELGDAIKPLYCTTTG